MIEVKQVITKKDVKEFMNFPKRLYKGNPYYVPVLDMDEKKIFRADYVYNSTCDVVFYLAYKDGVVAGRISGIIQKAANEKWGQKRVRFTRFDSIDDQEVANALFDTVSAWAREKGMTEIVGPLGYSDLEREGMLIEGFDQLSTYEEQYNYEYYQKLVENYGFTKEVDWWEHKIYRPTEDMGKVERISNKMLEKYGLTYTQPKSIKWFLKNYVDEFFEIIDKTYTNIYGTVPFTQGMKDMMVSNFKLLARSKDICLILNEEKHVVGFAIMFPSIAKAANKSKGKLTLPFLLKILRLKRHAEVIDLGLIGVLPEYESKGVASIMMSALAKFIEREKPDHLETNLILEENAHSMNQFRRFDRVLHKKRRCFIKEL
ncbi:MAG: hypothetical protein SPL13_03690 [Clostridia bacterium]|nr:hypothetical protein [Clostridia bacterium]